MSKETAHALECPGGCGQRIAFLEYHLPHCTGEREDVRQSRLARIQARTDHLLDAAAAGVNALTAAVMEKMVQGDKLKAAAETEEKISRQRKHRATSRKNATRKANTAKKGKRK